MTRAENEERLQGLRGLKVSRAWTGYGAALFLDLGALAEADGDVRGEAGVMVESEWRIESGAEIVVGSWDGGTEVQAGLERLVGLRVEAVRLTEEPTELVLEFTGGVRVRTFTTRPGTPRWGVRVPGGPWMDACGFEGFVVTEEGVRGEAANQEVEKRWGVRVSEGAAGRCGECDSYRALYAKSGLEYGLCTEAESPFDGRAVHLKSGCERFRAE